MDSLTQPLTHFSRGFPQTDNSLRQRQKSLNTSMNTLQLEVDPMLISPMADISSQTHGLHFAPMVQPFIPARTHSMQEFVQNMPVQGSNTPILLPQMPSQLDDLVSEDIKSVCNDFHSYVKADATLDKRASFDSLPDFYSNYQDFTDFHKRSSNLDLNQKYAKLRHSESFEQILRPSESAGTLSTIHPGETLIHPMRSSDSLHHHFSDPYMHMRTDSMKTDSFHTRTDSMNTDAFFHSRSDSIPSLDVQLEPDFSMFMDPAEDAKLVMNDIQKKLDRQRCVSASAVQDQAKRERRIRRMSESTERSDVTKYSPSEEPPMDEEESEDAKPRKQTLKFENDMYTPHWVRYQGSKKEGYCDLCKPGRWLQLKTSAYWYHKQFTHGISSITGRPFKDPVQVRTVWETSPTDNGEISVFLMTEGQCHQCNDWHPLYRNKKRFSQNFKSSQEATEFLLSPAMGQTQPALILTSNPLKILVGKTENGDLAVPPGMNVSQSTLKDMKSHENGMMSGVWWKHAHKCHVNE